MKLHLATLAMGEVRLRARTHTYETLGPHGAESAVFEVSAGPGEAFGPIGQVSSGGELSRLHLAFKQCLTAGYGAESTVFDEVDAGIGGATADSVGRLLAQSARGRQVLCVTHLAQVAAYGATHLVVGKRRRGKRVVVDVEPVTGAGRRNEIARMLGGGESTARQHAEEMIAAASRRRSRRGRKAA